MPPTNNQQRSLAMTTTPPSASRAGDSLWEFPPESSTVPTRPIVHAQTRHCGANAGEVPRILERPIGIHALGSVASLLVRAEFRQHRRQFAGAGGRQLLAQEFVQVARVDVEPGRDAEQTVGVQHTRRQRAGADVPPMRTLSISTKDSDSGGSSTSSPSAVISAAKAATSRFPVTMRRSQRAL